MDLSTWVMILGVFTAVLLLGIFYSINRTNGSVWTGGSKRRYLLYVPGSYDPERPCPLVVCFHGFVQWPAHQQRLSGWNKLADQHGFLVVYPKGRGFPLRWNAQLSHRNSKAPNEDLEFFIDMLDHLSRLYAIDHSRIYCNGMSNGAGMSHLLACHFGDRIAAIGGVAGAYLYPLESAPDCPRLPVIAFHGTHDPVVPFLGGRSNRPFVPVQFPEIETWAADWAKHNGCEFPPSVEDVTSDINRVSYAGGDVGCDVKLYIIKTGGHTWPGGKKLPIWLTGMTNTDISATEIMWEFFKDKTRE